MDIHNVFATVKNQSHPLTMFRVQGQKPPAPGKKPVFLMHGIADSADAWIINGKKSPVNKLVDAGFDVWLGNSRGNKYNYVPEIHTQEDFLFWDFSFTTLGKEDTPAFIDYILNATNQKKLIYIGHSQGAT